LNIKNKVLYY